MKKLMMMLSMAVMLGGQMMAQTDVTKADGNYVGQGNTVVKDSVEDRSTPKEVNVKLVADENGTYTMTLQGFAGNQLEFEDITLNKVALEAAADGSQMLKFEPVAIDVTTKDGQKFNGAVGFDEANSSIKDGVMSFTMKFVMSDTRDLYVFFKGAKAQLETEPAAPKTEEAPQTEPATPAVPE